MDDLPELPFEKVLGYLSLEDRLKARAVSRRWYHKINSFKVKSLCYSSRPIDSIEGKGRWVSGALAQNFISSTRFASFFDTFGQTILSSLKHLCLCDIDLREKDPATFMTTLDSFGQLEQLDIVRADCCPARQFNLNLPMLTSLQLEDVGGIEKLTLEAPRLREVKILECSDLRLEIVHCESVERLLVDRLEYTEVKNLKNLQFLYTDYIESLDRTLLSSLPQLKKIHTNDPDSVSKLFEQKQRSSRADLKIYLRGLLLNGPDDPAMNALGDSLPRYLSGEWLVCLAENPSRRADLIPFYIDLDYSAIDAVAPDLKVGLLKLFPDFSGIIADSPVQDIQRFLDLLKNSENIELLWFECDQPQDLFDRLPENHFAVQNLLINHPPADLAFIFRLKHLMELDVSWPIDSETVRRAFEELPALFWLRFRYDQKDASIEIFQPKEFEVSVDEEKKTVTDLNTAIEFIFGKEEPSRSKKRKAKDLK